MNADRIKSGLMTGKMIKTRAKARSVSADTYMRGNLLSNEVKAEDVAKAFFHLAVSKKQLELCLQLMVVTLLLL